MTSPLVVTNVALVRATVRVLRTMVGGFADRVLRAAGLSVANVTAVNGQRALELLRSRPAELPKAVLAAVVVESFAKLAAVCNAVLNVATLAERLDSAPLSFRVIDVMNALTGVVGYIENALRRIEGVRAAVGVRGLGEVSDWLRFSGVIALFSGAATLGGGVVAGVALIIFAEVVDKIDGVGSDAAALAQAACAEQARSTGRACTPEEYRAFFADERERERADSLTGKIGDAVADIGREAGKAAADIGRSIGEAFSGALFWLLLIGGAGAALYFAAPALAERGAQTARRLRA